MSGTEIIALAAIVVSGVVGIATLGFSLWNSNKQREHSLNRLEIEQEDRYRSGLYEKRLDLYQETLNRVQRLNASIDEAEDSQTEAIRDSILSFFEWFRDHTLYFDPVSIHELNELARIYSAWISTGEEGPISAQVDSVTHALVKGIGGKHLDWESILDDMARIGEVGSE